MKGFFKYVFASTLGFILGNIIIFIISFFIIMGFVSLVNSKAHGDKEVKIKENSVLNINFNSAIVERNDDNPFVEFAQFSDDINFPLSLKEIIDNVKKAKEDANIKAIFMNLSVVPAEFATLEEVRNVLIDFKTSGKPIFAYAEIMTEGSYYLASVANKVYMEPQGMFKFDGFHSEQIFVRGFLEDKLNIKPKLVRGSTCDYKSAGEMFIRDSMSSFNRKQLEELYFPLWDNYLAKISESRGVSVDDLKSIANEYKIQNINDAVTYKMLDGAFYIDQVHAVIKEELGLEKLNFVKIANYKYAEVEKKEKKKPTRDRIALIYAVGDIKMGQGNNQSIGSDGLSKAIRKARLDDHVKAIVLRINSPGGSALASDVIWREVDLAAKAKPLVVSMGNYAASGGYYIATPADTIVAQPNTITGSIGVFGMFMNLEEFWKSKLGISFDRVVTADHADFMNPNRAMTKEEELILQKFIDGIYLDFTTKVSQGRNIDIDSVESMAQGRVWSGIDAKKLGLVDVLGGMYDAIDIAANMAGIEDYKLKILPNAKTPIEEMLSSLSFTKMKQRIIRNELNDDYGMYQQLKEIREMNGVYMQMPYYLKVD